MKKVVFVITILLALCMAFCGCNLTHENAPWVEINEGESATLNLGESMTLTSSRSDDLIGIVNWTSSNENVVKVSQSFTTCTVEAVGEGTATVTAKLDKYVDSIQITVVDNIIVDREAIITLECEDEEIYVTATTTLSFTIEPQEYAPKVKYRIVDGEEFISLTGDKVKGVDVGTAKIEAYIEEYVSNLVTIEVVEQTFDDDPYIGVASVDFYSDYEPAVSAIDAYYRTLHGFISGSIEKQSQEPTLSNYRPTENGKYLRNTSANYSADGNEYYVLDAYGQVVNTIYKNAGYVALEDVAAYVFAFADIPANYVEGKNVKPQSSVWGKYLRLNHSRFSGSTTNYPYEPELPRISGCGGDLQYYEIDIGTTGTDCDPAYQVKEYNNGMTITRGAARIVYTRYNARTYADIDTDERYVFYTYNHYNDFQEYLNYYGGWGEMFGNITGGGKLSSKTDYNPTSYVETIHRDFKTSSPRSARLVRLPEYVIVTFKRSAVA